MRSFRHFPELGCCNPTPRRISAMLRYGFSFCLCLPDTLYSFNWSPFLHGKRTRRVIRGQSKNSFDFGINISNKYSHTFEKIHVWRPDPSLLKIWIGSSSCLISIFSICSRHAGVGFAMPVSGVLLRWVGLRGLALSPCSPRPGFPNLRIPPWSC